MQATPTPTRRKPRTWLAAAVEWAADALGETHESLEAMLLEKIRGALRRFDDEADEANDEGDGSDDDE